MAIITCIPKILTPEEESWAQQVSLQINPANAGLSRTIERQVGSRSGERRLALEVGYRWPIAGVRLSVQFLDSPDTALRKRLLLHMNAWNKTANILFVETRQMGHVRVARAEGGFWSYVGTQILVIKNKDLPTMNLEGFTMKTPDSEFHRVVRHEAGHTLGFPHEHMRSDLVRKIDEKKAIAYYFKWDRWSAKETRQQVLTPLKDKSIMGTTEADPTSIMCYQIPAGITKDGQAIPGGTDINDTDFAFAGKVYPKKGIEPPPPAVAEIPFEHGANSASDTTSVKPPQTMVGAPASLDETDTFHIVILDEFDSQMGMISFSEQALKPAKGRKKKPKYAHVFASYGGARVSCALRLRADRGEEPTVFGKIIRVHEAILNYTNYRKGSLPDDERMKDFGADLFNALFSGVVGRLYDEARARQRNRKLDLVFTSMISWIAEKPWEFAYDKDRNSFLATEEVHLIRNVLTAVPANMIAPLSGPLKILVVSAQPVGFGRLSIEQEVDVIARGFQPLVDAGAVTIKVMAHATPGLIQGELVTGDYNIVHFIGHGAFDEGKQQGTLIFENERGGSYSLGERSLREIFCHRGLSLVFLNACQTGAGGKADFNKGVAQSLVSHGLPALVANQYSVLDSSATSFAQFFYWALAQGMGIGAAAREARIAVNYSLTGDSIDWAVPVVYARDPNKPLCARPPMVNPVPATSMRSETGISSVALLSEVTEVVPAASMRGQIRRQIRDRKYRIAVWDIDNVFPSLETTLEKLNATQSVFGFEVVALSAPLDIWDSKKAPDKQPYLRAEKLAERLKRSAIDLGVDVLACITRHWMRDDNKLNIYGWWDDSKETPVVLFSAAGMDNLKPEGQDTDRLLANALVQLLSGSLSASDTHPEKRETECPLFSDNERDFNHLAGRQEFDRICQKKLKAKIGQDVLDALKTLLKTFH